MKKLYTIIFVLLSHFTLNAQLDINIQLERPGYSDWQQVINNAYQIDKPFLSNAYYLGVGYRYFPSDTRIGLVPEIGYSFAFDSRENALLSGTYNIHKISLIAPVQFFPMDLYGDCNCPTFTRQNRFFQTAFYLKVIPGIALQLQNYDIEGKVSFQNLIYSVGVGAGMNFAMSDLLTLTPEVSYNYIWNEKWEGFAAIHDEPQKDDKTTADRITAGLRLSFYF
jgi:opacity protein-like surface antigen